MYLAALDPMSLVRALPGNVAQGIIWGIMALGVYITFRILDFADLTVDGSLATGGAVAVMLIRGGMNPALALLFAFLAGMAAGFVTGILHTFFGIPGILASILTQIGLYSVNLGIMGKSNQAVNVMQYKLVASLRYVTGEGSELFFVKLIVAALILFFAWPAIFGALVSFGEMIMGAGAIGAGIPPYEIKQIVTVCKAYSSAVGAGAFVSEIFGDEADELRRRGGDGGEYGATTGRPRRMGWYDCVASKYGCRLQGATDVAFTVLDVLGYLDEIPVCVAYDIDGEITTDFPTTARLEKAKPVIEKLPGWKCDIRGIKNYEDLPENCRKYIEFIEEKIGYPITMVSNGPGRNDIIYRNK